MAQYANLKADIVAAIYNNSNQEITGAVLQGILTQIVDTVGADYLYVGVATPTTNPGTIDQRVFYIASQAGTYTNFGGIVVAEDDGVVILKYNSSWTKETTGIVSAAQLNQLGQKIDDLALGKFYGFFPAAADLPAGDEPGYAYVGASSPFAIYVFKDGEWSDSGSVYAPSEGNGEDIDTNAQGKLQFANRPTTYGMGYKILRRNKTFAEQVTKSDTIYEIRYDFDLDGASVTIPAGCVLKFVGGKIINGRIVFNDTFIDGAGQLFENVYVSDGKIASNELYASWFGAIGDGVADDTAALNYFLNFLDFTNAATRQRGLIYVLDGTNYRITNTIQISTDDKDAATGAGQATLMGRAINMDYRVQIVCENLYVPIFRIYSLRWAFENIDVRYASVAAGNSGAVAFKFKPKDDDNADLVHASASDTYCRNVAVHNAEIGFECWGNQFQFDYCNLSKCRISFSLNKYVNEEDPTGTDTARAILIRNCRYHDAAYQNGAFVKINNPTIWGVVIDSCYIDGFYRKIVDGTLYHAVVTNNYMCKLSVLAQEETYFIYGDVIHSKIDGNMVFAYLKGYLDNPTRRHNGIVSRVIRDSVISNNMFEHGFPAVINTDCCFNTVICGNTFSNPISSEPIVDYNGDERTDIPDTIEPIMYLGNYENRANTYNITITGNVFRLRKDGQVIAFFQSNKAKWIIETGNALLALNDSDVVFDKNNIMYNGLQPRNNKTLNNVIASIEQSPTTSYISGKGANFYVGDLDLPVWWNGSYLLNAFGLRAAKTKGTTAERPSLGAAAINVGVLYYDTDLGKYIVWNGTTWVNVDGTNL